MADFITDYMPPVSELTPAQVAEAREKLTAYLAQILPDEDTRPNTLLGDRLITPFAMLVAAFDEGVRRVQNDLQLERVAAGEVYNCEFVKSYLKNFGTLALLATTTHTYVRLTFSDATSRTLPSAMSFSDGTQVLQLEAPAPGNIEIRAPGTGTGSPNDFELQLLSTDSWFVDLPVSADLTSDLEAGTLLRVDRLIPGMTSATPVQTLPAQSTGTPVSRSALQTLSLMYVAGAGLRGQLAQLVRQLVGRSTAVSVVQSGDPEMLRDGLLLGNQAPCVDLVVANPLSTAIEQIVVWCKYVTGTAGGASGMLVGQFIPQHPPLRFLSALSATTPNSAYDLVTLPGYEMVAEPLNPASLPKLTGAYGTGHRFWLMAPMPKVAGVPQFPVTTNAGESGAWVTLRFVTDRSVRLLEHKLANPELAFGGFNLQVRRAIPFWIDSLTLTYRRTNGRSFNRAQAEAELTDYLNNLVYPAVYSVARIADIFYYAGASALVSVTTVADTRPSPATRLRTTTVKNPKSVPLEVLAEETLAATPVIHTSLDALQTVGTDTETDPALRLEWAAGPRNRVPMLSSTLALNFVEVP